MGLMGASLMSAVVLDAFPYMIRCDSMVASVSKVKAQFSRLLRRVEKGLEITITKRGVPIARLVPIQKSRPLQTERGV
jgi:prevent-host-death family protein